MKSDPIFLIYKSAVAVVILMVLGNAARPPALEMAPEKARKPNVIFVLADDLGYKDLGCYGNTFIQTPNLDQLAKSGIRFTQAYAASPVCSPTRASLMTGKYPARLGITDWIPGRQASGNRPEELLRAPEFQLFLPAAETTLGELFRSSGYVTGYIGKWHLGKDKVHFPGVQGFDQVTGTSPYGSPYNYHFPYQNSGGRQDDLALTGREGEYLTDRLSAEAVKFVETQAGKPFFLFLAHYAPHTPIQPRSDLLEKYERLKAKRQPELPVENPHYAAMVESLDEGIGRIIETLRRKNLLENTLIVFTSDNGGLTVPEGRFTPSTTVAPYRDGKGYLYEGGIRVPFLLYYPALAKAGAVSDAVTFSADFFPSFSHLLKGKAMPGNRTDGISWLPVLNGGMAAERTLYWHYPHYSNQGGRPGSAIRQGKWKLIEHFEDRRLELFDLESDPGEKNNLAGVNAERAASLHRQLKEWQNELRVSMPVPK